MIFMKTFKKLTTALLTAMLVLSTTVTGVSATETTDLVTTESTQVEVHEGDTVNFWVEVAIPEGQPDVTGWTVDMYYDEAIFDVNADFADGNGFASGDAAIDYALGTSSVEAELPGGNLTTGCFKDGWASFADANYYGFDYVGNTSKVICIQLKAVASGTATLAYKMRDIVDSELSDTSYIDKTSYQLIGGAEGALKYNVVCNHSTLPTDKVGVFGDVNVDFTEVDTNIYSGTADLDAGTYTFRVNEFGTQMCFGYSYTDTMYNVQYSPDYKSATTLTATGGRYTFTYNTSTNRLTIKFKPYADLVELFGDINVELVRTSSTSTIYTGSARVEAGSYTFKINDQGVEKGFGYTFEDVVYNVAYNEAWTGATTFNATGGIYSVKYDASTSQLTFKHATPGVGDVRVFGDINVDLVKDYGTLYSATQALEAGTYEIRVDSFGETLCNGSEFTDTIYKVEYKSEWKSATKFNATAGKYTFRFDSATNQLTILYAPLEEKVSIFGDIELELTSSDSVKYTGRTTLAAGTYSFRVDDFGITYCCGGTFTDAMGSVQYSSEYKSATTFVATGGDYGFSYDKTTHKLTVYKIG